MTSWRKRRYESIANWKSAYDSSDQFQFLNGAGGSPKDRVAMSIIQLVEPLSIKAKLLV